MYYNIHQGNKIIYDFLISKCNGKSILFSIDNNILRNLHEEISEEDWNNSNIILSTDYDSLKFHSSWDWLIPVIQIITEFDKSFADEIHLSESIKSLWNSVVRAIDSFEEMHRTIGEEFMYNDLVLKVFESEEEFSCKECYFNGRKNPKKSIPECSEFKHLIGDCANDPEIIFKEIKK